MKYFGSLMYHATRFCHNSATIWHYLCPFLPIPALLDMQGDYFSYLSLIIYDSTYNYENINISYDYGGLMECVCKEPKSYVR
jgi:hypothetical protein